jgi:hypothetical protein
MYFKNRKSIGDCAYVWKRTPSRVTAASRPNVSFSSDGSTSPRNYGWLFVLLHNSTPCFPFHNCIRGLLMWLIRLMRKVLSMCKCSELQEKQETGAILQKSKVKN